MTSEQKIPRMAVKLGEVNELKFRLSIKGSTSDPEAREPKVRFMVTETKTGLSVCFPMEVKEEGVVKVMIPSLPGIFRENTEYTGNVEVIVGSRWFNPTTVGLVFEQDMEVEASPVLSEQETAKLFSVESLDTSSSDNDEEEDPTLGRANTRALQTCGLKPL